MSIIDSAEDLAAAQARLEAASDTQLEHDLTYWAAAAQDASEEHDAIVDKLREAKVLFAEAQHHVTIIVVEVRKRRDAKRERAAG